MKKKKTLLILGSSGFIGKNLVEKFSKKYKILKPLHKELDLIDQKTVTSYFRKHKVDIVINAVVIGGSRKEEHEEDALKNNLRIFLNLIENKRYYKKMIHLGSGGEYDKSRPIINIREDNLGKYIPVDDYSLFKYICSKVIEKSENIVSLRIFGLFGKYENYRYRFISNAICKNILGMPITINQDVYFDYVYIDDFIRIIEYFINNKEKHKFYNIGTGKKINLIRLAKTINNISETKSKIIVKNRGLNNEYTCNNNRLIKEIREFKFSNIDKNIIELYNWYYENKSFINKINL